MCLYTKKRLAKISLKPIECVKIVLKHYKLHLSLCEGIYHYETPYRKELVDDEYIDGEKPFKAKGIIKRSNFLTIGVISYGPGLVHTFKSIEDARKNFPDDRLFGGDEIVAFKCYIMPGTRYFEGEDLNGSSCYAAKKIVFGEKIDLKTTK